MHIPMTPVISSPEWNAAGFNVSSNTCAFPAQKGLLRLHALMNHTVILIFQCVLLMLVNVTYCF